MPTLPGSVKESASHSEVAHSHPVLPLEGAVGESRAESPFLEAGEHIAAWLRDPLVMMVRLFSGAGFVVSYLFLRRTLFYLDPTSVVPERVRRAFDSLRVGILILDHAELLGRADEALYQYKSDGRNRVTVS